MAGELDPVDAVAGLNTTDNVSKSGFRGLLKNRFLGIYATGDEFANADAAARSVVFIQEYEQIYVKSGGDTTTPISESLVRDANGIAFQAVGTTGERVAFSAHKNNTNQTGVLASTATALTFSHEEYDEGGYFNTSTGRFTPPSGKYLLVASVGYFSGLVDQSRFGFYVYKNGSAYRLFLDAASGTGVQNKPGECIVEANGTDYFEIYAYAEGTGTKVVYGSTTMTFFSGFKIDGQRGTSGADGQGLDYDAHGLFAGRSAHDAEGEGFAYLSTDGDDDTITDAVIFVMGAGGSGDWSDPIEVRGPQGPTGATGATGAAGATGATGATGSNGTNGSNGAAGATGATGAAGISGTSAATRIRVLSTTNVVIATALENGDTLNGVVLATNDLVLLTGQTAPAENGVYVVPASGTAPRHTDFDAYDELPGTIFSVMEGTTKADTLWRCTSNRGGTIGVTSVVLAEIVGGMAPANNLSDVSSVAIARTNLGIANLRLSVSASSGALTVAIKTAAGTDASATDPIFIPLADGTTVALTAALSLVLTSGSTFGFTSAAAGRLWYLLFNDSGTLRLGAVNARGANSIKSLNPAFVESSTAEGGVGGADTAGTIYTGTAVTDKNFAVIGFSTWESGLTTAGTWTAPTAPPVYWHPGIPLPGMPTGNAVSATTTSVTTCSATTYTDTALTAAITYKSAANLTAYSWHGPASTASTSSAGFFALRRGGAVVGHSSIIRNLGGTFICNVGGFGSDFPGSIGPHTYTVAGHVTTAGQDAFFVNTGGGGHDAGGVLNLAEIMG